MKMKTALAILLALVGTSLAISIAAQEEQAVTTTPASEETGEPEGTAFTFPPLKMGEMIYRQDNEELKYLARKIENGTATVLERRVFYRLDDYLFPYKRPIPNNWRKQAADAIRCLTPPVKITEAGVPETSYSWSLLGPTAYKNGSDVNSGRATAIWVDPGNKNTIILGTADGGVWKTTNQGGAWTSLFDSAASTSIGSIAVDPNNTQIIYVGTGEGNFSADGISGVGIYKSTDGGSTWTLVYSGTSPAWTYALPYHNVRRMAVDPRNSSKVYASIDGGLLYSGNGGTSWALTTCGASGTLYGTDLAVDSVTPAAGQPSIVYMVFGRYSGAAPPNGVYRNTDGNLGTAASWTNISTSSNSFPTANVGRISLLQAPSDKKQLYALVDNSSTHASLGIWYCSNATAATPTWAAKSTTNFCSAQCWYDMTGTVDPNNPAKLIVGGLDNYISTNNAGTLSSVSCWSCGGTSYSHADHHHMIMPDSTTLYDANDGGFFIGTVSGSSVTWTNKNTGLSTLQFYGIAQHPTDATKYQGGLQDNGQAYNSGSAWTQVAGGDGGWSAWDQSSAGYAYEEYVYAGIKRNTNMTGSPSSWTCIQNFGGCSGCGSSCIPDNQAAFIAIFALDPNQQNTMYSASKYVYRNTNVRGSTTWTSISPDLSGDSSNNSRSYVYYLHAAKNNGTSGLVYAGAFNNTTGAVKFWVTSNANTASPPATWTDRSAGLPNQRVKSIVTDPTNANRVLVTFAGFDGNRIYRSTDGGANWTNISGALPQIPCYSVVLDPADPNHAYVGMEMGVFDNVAVWTGTAWNSVTANLPAVASAQLEFNPVNGKLRNATHGRGMWELTVTASLPNPKEASPAGNMTAAKGTGTVVNVTYTNGCGATDNTVYAGASPPCSRAASTGRAGTATRAPRERWPSIRAPATSTSSSWGTTPAASREAMARAPRANAPPRAPDRRAPTRRT